MRTHLVLRVVLGIICVSHLLLGVLAFVGLPGQVADAVATVYGANLSREEITPQLQHVVRMLGAYMIAFGVLAGYALLDPVRNRFAIDVLVLLFLERVVQRLLFADEIRAAFDMTAARLWLQAGFFLVFPVLLLIFRPRREPLAPATAGAAGA